MKLDLTTIILTYNEELHIRRALECVSPISQHVIIVDSPSTDSTIDICKEFDNVEVFVHKYPGNQAEQFNWALENIDIKTGWILRIDADEYLEPELIEELYIKLPTMRSEVSAVVIPIGREFMGRRLHHGIVNEVALTRLFRTGKVHYELRLMDEYMSIHSGETISFEHAIVDASLIGLKAFIDKHNNYSNREAVLLLDAEFNLTVNDENNVNYEYAKEVAKKRAQKAKYSRMPLFWRAFAYFVYRYIVKMGFLDGKEGFCWDFFQGLWYRMLVDAKIYEAKKVCGNDKQFMITYIKEKFGIQLKS